MLEVADELVVAGHVGTILLLDGLERLHLLRVDAFGLVSEVVLH